MLAIALGRILGAAGAGAFFTFANWVQLSASVAGLGTATYVLRHVAIGPRGHVGHVRAVRQAFTLTFVTWLVMCLVTLIGEDNLVESLSLPFSVRLLLAATLLMAILRLGAESLKAYDYAVPALLIEYAVVPASVLLAMGVALLYAPMIPASFVVYSYVLGIMLALACLFFFVSRDVRVFPVFKRTGAVPASASLMSTARESLSYWGVQLETNLLGTIPYVVLPAVATLEEIGLFAVAHRLVGITGTINIALVAMFSPRFSRAMFDLDYPRLKREYRSAQVLTAVLYAPVLAFFIVVPGLVLSLFGEPFRGGGDILVILGTGRVVNSLCGLPDPFLAMTGHARFELMVTAACLVLFGACVAFLVRDVESLAVGYAAILALRGVLSTVVSYRVVRSG